MERGVASFDRLAQMTLSIVSPNVIRFRATLSSDENEPSFTWTMHVSEAAVPRSGRVVRSAVGTLVAKGLEAWGDIDVGAYLVDADMANEELQELLVDSDASETIYDIARMHLQSMLATINTDLVIPYKSPEVDVHFAKFASDDDEGS